MMFPVTALYASALAILMIALMVHVILHRARTHVSLGFGEDGRLHEAIRRHGNMVETVPMALILLALAEAGGLGAGWLHLAGGLLLAGRIIHPFGLSIANPASVLRIAGVSASWAAMLVPLVFLLRAAAGP